MMMNRRKKTLLIVVPVFLVILIGVITTLSLPIFTLGPEKISLYDVTYESTDFTLEDISVKYYDRDELIIKFFISGGDGSKDLRFEFVCRDETDAHIYASTSGTMLLEAIGYALTNSTSIGSGDLVMGVLVWADIPSGTQQIRATVDLTDIVLDTESFFIDLRQY
jgi:hypothetical protein